MTKHARRMTVIALVGLAAATATGVWWQVTRLPKRFAVVAAGSLYRSGEVSPAQLEHLREDYGIGRVVCLLNPDDPATQAERTAAERLGITWENVPLTGDGASEAEDRARIMALLTAKDAPPTLVHCAAGANRTGLAIALYRIRVQGWTYEQALAEMKANGFEDLPKHENLRAALREAAANRP